MRSRTPKRTALAPAILLVMGAMACDGCPGRRPADRTGTSPRAGSAPAFADRPAVLATIPAGHELGEARFSADGRHVAFVATKGGSAFVLLDSTRYGPYQEARALVFAEGRSGLAYVARRDGKELVVADGVEGARYTAIEGVSFAPDGRVVYAANLDGQWRVVAGAREAAVPGPAAPTPLVSLDGRHVFYPDQRGENGKRALRSCSLDLADCVSGTEYDELAWPEAGQAGRLLAFAATKDGRQTVVTVDRSAPGLVERTHGWFDAVAHFAASKGGEHLVFLARRGEGHLLVKDGAELPLPFLDSPLDLVVSDGGRALLTAVVDGKVQVFIDGQRAGKGHEGVYFPTFSPDGANHAFVAERGPQNVLVVGDGEGPLVDRAVTPRFTSDGSRVVYRARRNGERFVVVADARGKTLREQPHYEAVFDVVFSPDGTSIGYGVRAGSDLWWKVEKL